MRGVILDRDGTLIDFVRDAELGVVTPAFHPRQIRLLPGVLDGLATLRDAGFALAVATNQPGAAKGELPRAAIEATNLALRETLEASGFCLAAFEVCLHHPVGGPGGDPALVVPCRCRKPGPEMIERIVARLGLDPRASFMIGDSAADLGAARAAGVRPALVMAPGRCELCPLPRGEAPGGTPALAAPRFDELARLVVVSG